MGRKRTVRLVQPCRRCGMPVENPAKGTGRVPDGSGGVIDVDDLILCLNCFELQNSGSREFWNEGWKLESEEKKEE